LLDVCVYEPIKYRDIQAANTPHWLTHPAEKHTITRQSPRLKQMIIHSAQAEVSVHSTPLCLADILHIK